MSKQVSFEDELVSLSVYARGGQIYDLETGDPVQLQPEARAFLTVRARDLVRYDELRRAPLSREEMENWIMKTNPGVRFQEVFPAGTEFSFYQKGITFTGNLEESLYALYKPGNPTKKIQLFECLCKVDHIKGENLPPFIPQRGSSLNDLHKRCYVHCFGNQGHATRNVRSLFEFGEGKLETYLKGIGWES